jgi:uncharacterized Zn finger protein
MPDLTPEPMAACTSAVGEYDVTGSSGDAYVVSCSGRWEWSCTCPSFKYHPDDWCKHIKRIVAEVCTWNQLIDGGTPDEHGRCPLCGHEVEHFTAMV